MYINFNTAQDFISAITRNQMQPKFKLELNKAEFGQQIKSISLLEAIQRPDVNNFLNVELQKWFTTLPAMEMTLEQVLHQGGVENYNGIFNKTNYQAQLDIQKIKEWLNNTLTKALREHYLYCHLSQFQCDIFAKSDILDTAILDHITTIKSELVKNELLYQHDSFHSIHYTEVNFPSNNLFLEFVELFSCKFMSNYYDLEDYYIYVIEL